MMNYFSIRMKLDDVIKDLIDSGYRPIGEGSFRKDYSKRDVNLVINVAKNEKGVVITSPLISKDFNAINNAIVPFETRLIAGIPKY